MYQMDPDNKFIQRLVDCREEYMFIYRLDSYVRGNSSVVEVWKAANICKNCLTSSSVCFAFIG